ncbi:hypothetical protein FSP39_008936 [Pinctada imbricata]|uniref:G-protein coupled receptors family 1 profile domain-containing protein n=1 Tax=Pinctada imbricata TaxID=66713 RepID=A0AA88YN99_PINIB|nr:hypothetical protein FSP39_008936 [Pinctada imbricata]
MSNYEEDEYEFYENMGSYVYDYYPEDNIVPHKYNIKAIWEVYFRGHINFLIAFTTLINNLVMILVFIRRSTRSQTTVLLSSLAVSDIIICVTRIPEAVHFNINGYYDALYVTYNWCVANHVLYIIYQIFRIMSNWITALLGFQRWLLYRIIPVVILAVTTILLAYFLRMRSLSFAPGNVKKDSQKKEAQYKRITIIILAIMVVFLVAELQDGVAFIIYAIELASDQKGMILSEDADIKWDTISTTISLIGYACNFWIFFFMSKQFRSALYDMFISRLRKIHTKVTLETGHFETASTLDRSTTASKEKIGL